MGQLALVMSETFLNIANELDGEAVSLAFASLSGPDCIKDIILKFGLRQKVYQLIKKEFEAAKDDCSTALDSSIVSLLCYY